MKREDDPATLARLLLKNSSEISRLTREIHRVSRLYSEADARVATLRNSGPSFTKALKAALGSSEERHQELEALNRELGALQIRRMQLQRKFPTAAEFREQHGEPPRFAEYLLILFIRGVDCDAIRGDLHERYQEVRGRFGERRAQIWYWKWVLEAFGPILKRGFVRLVGFASAYEAWARWISR